MSYLLRYSIKSIFILFFIFLGCSDFNSSEGCTNPGACNYNPDVIIDDGSCELPELCSDGTFACDPDSCSDSDTNPTITYLNIICDFNQEVAGFQFTLTDDSNLITLTGASGGLAEENGFMVSVGNGIVIGFSLDGSTIPSVSDILIQLEVEAPPSTQTCIEAITLSDPAADAIIDGSILRFDNNSNCITISP